MNGSAQSPSLRFTQFAVDHAAEEIHLLDDQGRFVYANEALCGAQAKKSITLKTRHQSKDGRTFPVEVSANFVEFDGKEYSCAFGKALSEVFRLIERETCPPVVTAHS
jgi:hypothetical protein